MANSSVRLLSKGLEWDIVIFYRMDSYAPGPWMKPLIQLGSLHSLTMSEAWTKVFDCSFYPFYFHLVRDTLPDRETVIPPSISQSFPHFTLDATRMHIVRNSECKHSEDHIREQTV
ncbi:hypothetical protein QQ045_018912 [Rhodiola kirilowii]